MFQKTKPNVSIAYIHVALNISAIRDWLKKPLEIGVDKRWALEPYRITHSIDLLVEDDIYFHRDANQYSHLIAGSHNIDDDIGVIEWGVLNDYFYVVLDSQRIVIGKFPLKEVRVLLQTGKMNSDSKLNYMKDSEIISLDGSDEYCKKILKKVWFSYGLIYSNDLASLDFSIPSPSHVVEYPDGD